MQKKARPTEYRVGIEYDRYAKCEVSRLSFALVVVADYRKEDLNDERYQC